MNACRRPTATTKIYYEEKKNKTNEFACGPIGDNDDCCLLFLSIVVDFICI